jgi:hypothetical protein
MRFFFRILGLLCLTAPAMLHAMVHHIEAVTPRAGQRGTTVEVILDGAFLKDPREILFFRPGIQCIEVKALPPMHKVSLHHGGYREDQVLCKFEIAPDCPLGLHPFKLRTATELTTLSTFAVTAYPVYHEKEDKQGINDAPPPLKPSPSTPPSKAASTPTSSAMSISTA